ncbi:MAG: molybdopterin-binding protein [Candidatus Macondimonas sp.]|jgi:molybdopterin-biosynthesis enzyme MoeA-like protein
MRIGLIIIGDELLNGRRQDRHLAHMIEALAAWGHEPAWCLMLGDDPDYLTEQLRRTLATPDLTFCFGGIGATPDDHTRPCVARAAGVPLQRHPEAAALIESRFGAAAHPYRIRMADLPEGARLIPNPVNQIPGFSLGDHHFVPGFPQMAWPMVDWVLETHYPHLRRATGPALYALTISSKPESELIPLMETVLAEYPEIKLSSLPHIGDRPHIELALRGEVERAQAAWERLTGLLTASGIGFESRLARQAENREVRDGSGT